MTRILTLALPLLLVAALLGGCARHAVDHVMIGRLDKKPKDATIDVYIGEYPGPFEVVANIDSPGKPNYTAEDKAKQIEFMKKRARKLGADAVHLLRVLPEENRNYVRDELVPFPAIRQEDFYHYILRGQLIVYTDTPIDFDNPRDPYVFVPTAAQAEELEALRATAE